MRIKILAGFFSILLVSSVFSESKRLSFPVRGMVTALEGFALVDADWNENWLSEDSLSEYNHGLCRIAAILSTASFAGRNALPRSLFQCYEAMGITEKNIECHYELNYENSEFGNDQCAFSFARKDIQKSDGKNQTLVFIVIRCSPTPGVMEWLSCFDIGLTENENGKYHRGFYKTALYVESALKSYIEEQKISVDSAKFLVTGHSRGASVANILAALMIDSGKFSTENLCAYTFAASNTTTAENASSQKYHSIWNITNAEDFVTYLPPDRGDWHFRKFGTSLVLRNEWNSDAGFYEKNCIPRITSIYKKFVLRDFLPFKTGSFFPIQFARLLAFYSEDAKAYESDLFAMHDLADIVIHRLLFEEAPFPENEFYSANANAFYGLWPDLTDDFRKILNVHRKGAGDYAVLAFIDSHANEAYLSQLLAMEEDEAFSQKGSTQYLISGAFDCAVFDESGETLLSIVDQHVVYESIKLPVMAMQLSLSETAIGFPDEGDYTIFIKKDSLLPSPVSVKIEQYNEFGVFETETEEKIFPSDFKSCTIKVGNPERSPTKSDISKAKIIPGKKFRWQIETSYGTNRFFTGGVHIGFPLLYASVLAGYSPNESKTLRISSGLGTEKCIFSRIYANIEGFCHFERKFENGGEETQNIVPAIRLSLSVKPRRTWYFFGGMNCDLNIKNNTLNPDPSFQFGVRF